MRQEVPPFGQTQCPDPTGWGVNGLTGLIMGAPFVITFAVCLGQGHIPEDLNNEA